MTIPPIDTLRKFVRDLLGYDQALIRKGRANFDREVFERGYIIVDEGVQNKKYTQRQYDSEAERQTISVNYVGDFTIDFFGDPARMNGDVFVGLLKSQESKNLQRTLGITIYQPSTLTNLRFLAGTDFGERYQLNLIMRYNVEHEVDLLRIDRAVIETPITD